MREGGEEPDNSASIHAERRSRLDPAFGVTVQRGLDFVGVPRIESPRLLRIFCPDSHSGDLAMAKFPVAIAGSCAARLA